MSHDPLFRQLKLSQTLAGALLLLLLFWALVTAAPATAAPGGAILIGDYVWQDFDGNGQQDDGPAAGLAGVTLRLYRDNGDGIFQPQGADVLVNETVTGPDGGYTLSSHSGGKYWVDVDPDTLPAGLQAVVGEQSRAAPYFLTVWSAQSYTGIDFGYSPRAALWGQVFYDYDLDGMQGLGEPGALGVEICVYQDMNADGLRDPEDTLLSCTTTDVQGGFSFSGLLRGHYLVVETPRSGMGNTTLASLPVYVDPWLASGQALAPIGDVRLGSVGGVLFVDVNGNQIRDPDENAGIAGATLHLQNLTGGDSLVAVSDVAGRFLFADLMPGAYALALQSYPAGYNLTAASPRSVQVAWGDSDLAQDFSFASPTHVTLAYFAVEALAGANHVHWQTSAEEGQDGFVILRSASETGVFTPVSGFIPAANSISGASYQWLDLSAAHGDYWYQLESLPDGSRFGPVGATPGSDPGGSRLFIPFVRR